MCDSNWNILVTCICDVANIPYNLSHLSPPGSQDIYLHVEYQRDAYYPLVDLC